MARYTRLSNEKVRPAVEELEGLLQNMGLTETQIKQTMQQVGYCMSTAISASPGICQAPVRAGILDIALKGFCKTQIKEGILPARGSYPAKTIKKVFIETV